MEWTPQWNRQILQLPVWTPGSYTVRDHAQHLHSLRLSNASTDQKVRRVSPSRWLCELTTLEPLTLTYAIESRDLTVRTGLLDPDFASLSLASVAMEIEGFRWMPHHLEVSAPSHWQVHLPLESSVRGWLAKDFDALIDTPLHAGPFAVKPFTVHGHRHELLLIGAPPSGWPESFMSDIERVCQATCDLMGTLPPAGDRYQLVLQLLEKGYGGLEHDHSAVLQFNWTALAGKKGYRQLLQLVGHEYLHQWNVRRLRPVELRPYDYSQPVICEGLWFAEGITSYYDLFLPLRAGCTDQINAFGGLRRGALQCADVAWTVDSILSDECRRGLGEAVQGHTSITRYPNQLLPPWSRGGFLPGRPPKKFWHIPSSVASPSVELVRRIPPWVLQRRPPPVACICGQRTSSGTGPLAR